MRSILFITSSRADYSLLRPLLFFLESQKLFSYKLVVCGDHLTEVAGMQMAEIIEDNINIDYKIKSHESKIPLEIALARVMIGFASAIDDLKPDLVFIPGDRYEMLGAASAALLKKVPIAHYAGGHLTLGSWDDKVRHAVTKLADLHFTTHERYRQRIIQMGEDPARSFVCGSLGLDNIKNLVLISKERLEQELDFSLDKRYAVVTIHSETMGKNSTLDLVEEILKALERVDNISYIFTYPNHDQDYDLIVDKINKFIESHKNTSKAYRSLGNLRYLSVIKYASFVIGNSSSGIVEVPSFKIPTINVGNRQLGRIKAASVIDVQISAPEIVQAINQACSSHFRSTLVDLINPNGAGDAAQRILNDLQKIDFSHLS
jgi:GDP/UDP-N,N'-diacetylbacillosamine 2-epimerase (hydrolysing)